jgi:meiotically up-regulated gene 157 (Mug157) protein
MNEATLVAVVTSVAERLGDRVAAVFESCFRNTLETTIEDLPDGSSFMVTGDIPAMWLRDSAAQLTPYLHFAADDQHLGDTIGRIVRRQLRYILLDPYANAFNREPNGAGHRTDRTELSPWVWERKYEVDSLCYPLLLAHDLWAATGRVDHLTDFAAAARATLALWRREQRHDAESTYRFERFDGAATDTLARGGLGGLTAPVGLTWSGFRPSDDAAELGFNIPANAFAVVTCHAIAVVAAEVLDDPGLAEEASQLAVEIDGAIREHGVVPAPGGDPVLAYEVDGLGGVVLMDDANVPSLLSLPFIGWCDAGEPVYVATRELVLSAANPYFARGRFATGIGSPHTASGWVWPIALAMQGLTSTDEAERQGLLETLVSTDAGTALMHESFDPDDPRQYSREWFSWANAMLCEFVLDMAGLRSYVRPVLGAGSRS